MGLRYSLVVVLSLFTAACSSTNPTPDTGHWGPDGGDGGVPAAFDFYTLDDNAQGSYPLALAVQGDKIAVAYWVEGHSPDGGAIRDLRYVEKGGTPETVTQSVRVYGASLALDPSGNPCTAYIGPPGNGGTYWYEANADVACKQGGAWTKDQTVAAVFDMVLGPFSAIAIEDDGTVDIAYRNCHNGQFQVQGAEHTDIGWATGKLGGWSAVANAVFGGDSQAGHGGYTSLIIADGQPTLVWSGLGPAEFGPAADVWFLQRNADKTWDWSASPPKRELKPIKYVTDTVTGPSIAWKKPTPLNTIGYFIAWEDHNSNQIKEAESPDGKDWSAADDIVQGAGSEGGYPSIAVSDDGLPYVAYYQCSEMSGRSLPQCPADDEVRLAWRVDPGMPWTHETVDPDGGHYIKLAFWQNRAVIAYKDVQDKVLKLAIQR
jgi:hypothetical protein